MKISGNCFKYELKSLQKIILATEKHKCKLSFCIRLIQLILEIRFMLNVSIDKIFLSNKKAHKVH